MYKNGPDDDWEERVAPTMQEGVVLKESPYPHPPDAQVPVSMEYNRLWLNHDDLIEVGYRNLEAGSIVFVGGRFYELQGPSQISRTSSYRWWVEEVQTEGAADDLHPAMFEQWKFDE